MQNFLTTSQMDMAHKVTNTNKFNTVEPYFMFFGRLSKEKGILTLGEGVPSGCRSSR